MQNVFVTPREKQMGVVSVISANHDVCKNDVLRHNRKQCPRIANARRDIVMHFRNEGYSFPKIGKILGKHHTTVLGWL